jgi:asparagine synthase (glutamine-hydrolysing)
MCGIFGTINRPFDEKILDLLRHRGPDDCGITQAWVGNHRVMLGHRRLSIVDLSPAGRQPMWTTCRRYSIVFNGEIYNHSAIRKQLRPCEYRGHSDTETVLNLLEQRHISSSNDLNGIFAFGFLDMGRRKIFLGRDAFGVKPLYYAADETSLIFSSELRPMRALLNDSIDLESLAELLRLRYLPAPDTLFRRIKKVRPGHVVEVDCSGNSLSVSEYPFVKAPVCGDERQGHGTALDQYGFAVENAVQRQLMSDVEIGLFLSGGVDSALVARLAQRHTAYRMKAFTVGFSEPDEADEIDDAKETASVLNLDHHVVRMGCEEFLNALPQITAVVEEPLATTSVVPMFYLSSLASEYVKVALSGQGADEAMGGYRRYQGELLKSLVPAFAIPFLRRGARALGVRHDALVRGLNSIGERDDVRRFEETYSVFTRAQIARILGHEPIRATQRIRYFYDLLHCSSRVRSVERMMSLDLRMNLADDLLLYTDKITMHHSIECRVPFLDKDLIQFVESLPVRYRVGLFRGKALHKQFARRLLPRSIVGRRKKGFRAPTGRWFKSNGRIADTLLDRTSQFSSYFDPFEVKKVLDEHAAGINRERHIFLLLGVYYWMAQSLGCGADPAAALPHKPRICESA